MVGTVLTDPHLYCCWIVSGFIFIPICPTDVSETQVSFSRKWGSIAASLWYRKYHWLATSSIMGNSCPIRGEKIFFISSMISYNKDVVRKCGLLMTHENIGFYSKSVQVMACCLTAPNPYLDWCWLIINKVLWDSPQGNFTGNVQDMYPMILHVTYSRLQSHLQGANE